MDSFSTKPSAQVTVRQYSDSPECDVVVIVREQTMVLKCRDYDQAVNWARIECKSYKIADDFTVEQVNAVQTIKGITVA
jgi:hypothetical protein